MKRKFIFICLSVWISFNVNAQTINGEYARALQAKYPSLKSDLCPSCKLWVNPYYKSIADTTEHRPVLTFYIYTKEHRLAQEQLDVPREGTYAAWYPGVGQLSETSAYSNANQIVHQQYKPGEIQKGHCQAWILLAYTVDGAILSDTYTFNCAMEFRGQNLGTEIASEELCRNLTGYDGHEETTDSVRIWCGTFGSQRTFTKGKVTNTVPAYYFKIIAFYDKIRHRQVEWCYWMPNAPDESQDKLDDRKKSYAEICTLLQFRPKDIFN